MKIDSPLSQFTVKTLIPIDLFGYNISFTNASLFMALAVIVTSSILLMAMFRSKIVPSRLQAFAEGLYNFVHDTLDNNTHGKGDKFFPLIFTVFTLVATLNLLGSAPYGYTVTSQLIVTSALAFVLFAFITLVGFIKHGFGFLSLFLPKGTPPYMAPLIILIEIFAYFVKPVALSIRLGANMIADHILSAVVIGFVGIMGIWGFVPISFIVIFNGFEIFVSILQAYIFTILACVYLNDAINLH